jgi:hypothetical protein
LLEPLVPDPVVPEPLLLEPLVLEPLVLEPLVPEPLVPEPLLPEPPEVAEPPEEALAVFSFAIRPSRLVMACCSLVTLPSWVTIFASSAAMSVARVSANAE